MRSPPNVPGLWLIYTVQGLHQTQSSSLSCHQWCCQGACSPTLRLQLTYPANFPSQISASQHLPKGTPCSLWMCKLTLPGCSAGVQIRFMPSGAYGLSGMVGSFAMGHVDATQQGKAPG